MVMIPKHSTTVPIKITTEDGYPSIKVNGTPFPEVSNFKIIANCDDVMRLEVESFIQQGTVMEFDGAVQVVVRPHFGESCEVEIDDTIPGKRIVRMTRRIISQP